MDGAFACPECGSSVQVRGLAPGRQVRCDFCDRLLEVPFLPRAADAPWKRRRFGRAKWLYWVWTALAVVGITVLVAGAFQFVKRQYQSAQQRSINHLLESSRSHEATGRLDQALIDLDTALEVARKAGPTYINRLGDWQKKRNDLALRDGQHVLDLLRRTPAESFSVGNWLNLHARAAHDSDLASLRTTIDQQFQAVLDRQVDFELAAARRDFESDRALSSLAHCERIAALIAHLAPGRQTTVRKEAEELVVMLVSTHGVRVEPPQGSFIFGPQSYTSDLVPVVVKALEAKNYLPYHESSPWRHHWSHALYHVTMNIKELREGTYLSSANRPTRIEVRLILTAAARSSPVFQTMPAAHSRASLPKLPALMSSRVATGEQSAEIERLLYDDARGQIDEKVARQLSIMPACPAARSSLRP
jgi:hypothetical protein